MNKILPILIIVACIGVFFAYISPTYTTSISAIQQKITSYDRALAAADAFTQRENELLAQKNQIPSDQLDRLQTFLPDNVDNVQLILDLSALAARTNVVLSGFSISQPSTDSADSSNASAAGGVPASPAAAGSAGPSTDSGLGAALSSSNLTDSIDLTVTVNGTYQAFRDFLAASEQSLRQLDVTNLSVATAGEKTGDTFTVTFRLYWLH